VIVAYSVPPCWEKKKDWVCGIAAWSVLERGFLRSRGGNMGESDSGSGLNFAPEKKEICISISSFGMA